MVSRPVREPSPIRAAVFAPWFLLAVFGVVQPGSASPCVILPAEPMQVEAAQAAAAAPKLLQIVILDGEDALNNVRDRTAREPIVEIQDENHKPVAGVLVLFTIHTGTGGAGAVAGGATSLSVTTGANGQAILQGFQVNQVAGSYTIDVQAKLGNLSAQNTIHESNASSPSSETSPSSPSSPVETAQGQPTATAATLGVRHGKFLVGAAVAGLAVALYFGVHAHTTGISAGAGSVHP